METSKQFMFEIKGKPFKCDCGCNIFHKDFVFEMEDHWKGTMRKIEAYICNACNAAYEAIK